MGLDREKTKELLENIDALFDAITINSSETAKKTLKKIVLGPAIGEIEKLVNESRPPVMLLMGRSGHGKSSVINALANKEVATVDDIRPKTAESVPYVITFEEQNSTWKVIDTRGIFETTKPNEATNQSPIDVLKESIVKYKPDVVMHIISMPETRNLSNDLAVYKEIMQGIKVNIPTIIVLTKADTLGNPREWPPEQFAKKAGQMGDVLDYMVTDVLCVKAKPMNQNIPYYGYVIDDSTYVGIVPVSALWDDRWNIGTLSDLIGNHLEESAQLDFFQAQERMDQLKKISSALIKRFSTIAGTIGTTPIPVADIAILTPLQILMISIIGALSGRPVSKDTATEYIAAAGVNIGAAIGLREGARQLVKLVPFGGSVISGSIAATSTYALGKSAEAYFFEKELKKPKSFMS